MQKQQHQTAQQNADQYSQSWPNDFNLRAEAAEQQEIVQDAKTWHPSPALVCSEYDI